MSLWRRLWNTFRTSHLDDDIAREIQTHLAETQDDAVKQGFTPEEARHVARMQFGNAGLYREQTHERSLLAWLEASLQDVRYTVRQLRQTPRFSIPTVLLLALGIGVNIAIFTLLNAIVLASLPLHHPDRLVVLLDRHSGGGSSPPSWLDQRDFREQNHVFTSVGAFAFRNTVLLQSGTQTARVSGSPVTPDYFTTLGVRPLAGRLFTPAEAVAGQDDVVLVREDFWHSQFGSDPAILGKTISINGRKCTIIGILPHSFTFPTDKTVLWIPLVPTPLQRDDRGWHGFPMIGRLKPGVTLAQAHADLDSIMLHLSRQYPKDDTDRTAVLLFPLRDWTVGYVRERLLILQYAALAVFLMSCANVSSLVLARYSSRRREFAMRAALGASRSRLIRQRLTEALAIATIGCLASVAVAWAGVKFLIYLYGSGLPHTTGIGPDPRLLWFALAVTLAAALLLGLTTALQEDPQQLESTLREGAGASGNRRSTRIRKVLVALQAACALTLVCSSFELVESFQKLMRVDPGLDALHLLTLHVALPESRYQDAARCNQFFAALTEHLNHLPGVQSAASINMLPVQQAGYNGDVEVPGLPPHSASFFTEYRWITGDYFRTMGIPLVRGRDFLPEELSGARHAVIINETMARTLWRDRDPVGWTLKLNESKALNSVSYTVIGVAQDVHQSGLDVPARSEIEFPLSTMPEPMTDQAVVLRSTLPEATMLASIRQQLQRLDPGAAVFDVNTMQEVLSGSYSIAYTRILALLLSAFAVLALLIAAFGLYSVTSYIVTERLRELAIRLAVGASPSNLMQFVLRQSAPMLALGIALGAGGAFLASRSLQSMLFGLTGLPVFVLCVAVSILTAAAALGLALPAFRATHLDPVQILRQE
ncbi:MAG TPA: ABC transporter permease [Bryobacteraceae bacterium]|nr:ABC transporter permease [Bryobacteraceae bacterium]